MTTLLDLLDTIGRINNEQVSYEAVAICDFCDAHCTEYYYCYTCQKHICLSCETEKIGIKTGAKRNGCFDHNLRRTGTIHKYCDECEYMFDLTDHVNKYNISDDYDYCDDCVKDLSETPTHREPLSANVGIACLEHWFVFDVDINGDLFLKNSKTGEWAYGIEKKLVIFTTFSTENICTTTPIREQVINRQWEW